MGCLFLKSSVAWMEKLFSLIPYTQDSKSVARNKTQQPISCFLWAGGEGGSSNVFCGLSSHEAPCSAGGRLCQSSILGAISIQLLCSQAAAEQSSGYSGLLFII